MHLCTTLLFVSGARHTSIDVLVSIGMPRRCGFPIDIHRPGTDNMPQGRGDPYWAYRLTESDSDRLLNELPMLCNVYSHIPTFFSLIGL